MVTLEQAVEQLVAKCRWWSTAKAAARTAREADSLAQGNLCRATRAYDASLENFQSVVQEWMNGKEA